MKVSLHPHAKERLAERGTTEAEVVATITGGEQFPAKFGRAVFGGTSVSETNGAAKFTRPSRLQPSRFEMGWVGLWSPWLSDTFDSMKLTYDPRRNIGYLRFHEKTAEVETIQLSDALNVDLAPNGTVYGIELLNANEQLRGDNGGHLVVVNEAAGKTEEIVLEI
jgi:uncharacterized protein YuzE